MCPAGATRPELPAAMQRLAGSPFATHSICHLFSIEFSVAYHNKISKTAETGPSTGKFKKLFQSTADSMSRISHDPQQEEKSAIRCVQYEHMLSQV